MAENGKPSVGKAIVEGLVAENTRVVFGLIGSHIVDIYDELDDSSINCVTSKHETNASLMAEAYARLTGTPGVCLTTAGPGTLNCMGGVGQAQYFSSPLVQISGAVPTGAVPYELHGTNDEAYTAEAYKPLCKLSLRVTSASDVPAALAECFAVARSGVPGPTRLEIPWDLFDVPLEPYSYQPFAISRCPLEPASAAILVDALRSSTRASIVIERVAAGQRIAAAVLALAEKLNAPVLTSRGAIGVIPWTTPHYAGVLDPFHFGSVADDVLRRSDLILRVGSTRQSFINKLMTESTGAQIVDIPLDQRELLQGARDLTYVSTDLGATLEHLLVQIEQSDRQVSPTIWWQSKPDDIRQKMVGEQAAYSPGGQIKVSWALAKLAELIESDTTVIQDVGCHEIWSRTLLPVTEHSPHIGSSNWAGMGFAIPGAIAARAADPNKRVVAITGDGCLLMSLTDMVTLNESGGPSVLIVFNDSEYSLISHFQTGRHDKQSNTRLSTVNFTKFAEGVGMQCIRVIDCADLEDAYRVVLRSESPILLEITCEPQVALSVFPDGATERVA